MSSPQSLTQKWLRHNLQSYPNSIRLYTDIDLLLTTYPTIRPKSDIYTYDDGRTQLLLCLHGLLPIAFRGASYNIPVAIWFTRDYPDKPPIVYVVPTNHMLVKPGKYLDTSGRCTIEYIQNWERKSEGCSLAVLLEAMQDQFSREPPVYAKPQPQTSPSRPPVVPSDPRSRPAPLLPSSQPVSSPTQPSDRPPLPPRPSAGPIYTQTRSIHSPGNSLQPVHHVTQDISEPSQSLDTLPPRYTQTSPPIPSRPMIPVATPHPIAHVSQNSADSGVLKSGDALSDIPSPPVPPHIPLTVTASPIPPKTNNPRHYTPEHLFIPPTRAAPIVNLLDEDSPDILPNTSSVLAPPPRPPNPELLHLHEQVHQKLITELNSLSQALALDAERLRAHQTDLLAGEPAIQDEMSRLKAVRDVSRNVALRLKGSVNQAETNMAELRRKGDPEVDELICSTTIVHNQLINLVAEDNAIEDTIYHLHRALNSGRIDLERFLRSTRLLAEEQFMKRALIERIQEGIPMGMSINSDWS